MFNFAHAETSTLAETPTLIDIGSEEIGEIVDYTRMVFNDFMPILTLVFGVMIGVLVIGILIKLLKN